MIKRRIVQLLFLILFLMALVGCNRSTEPVTATPLPTSISATATRPPTSIPATATATSMPPTSVPAKATSAPPTAIPATATPPPTLESVTKPTYFTPSQTEGPYYTVNKPTDRDNDLTVVKGSSGKAKGDQLDLSGKLYDRDGNPISGATIEIWQTDNEGIYLHPNDPKTSQRDPNFQSYGETITSADGSYSFRTIVPGQYEPRPRHIHVKVKLDGKELLTTQFYFSDDPKLATDRVSAGADIAAMTVDIQSTTTENGTTLLIGRRDIVLQNTRP